MSLVLSTPGDTLVGMATTAQLLARARRAADKIERARQLQAEAAAERAAALAALVDAGMSKAEIARQLGVTRAAIGKILRERP